MQTVISANRRAIKMIMSKLSLKKSPFRNLKTDEYEKFCPPAKKKQKESKHPNGNTQRLGSWRMQRGGRAGETKHVMIVRDIILDDIGKNYVPTLKFWAQALGITNASNMRKPQLIQSLEAIGKS